MKLLAIDPGTTQSAWCRIEDGIPTQFGTLPNNVFRGVIRSAKTTECVIEMVACYGMPVGREVFETAVWIGRFIETWNTNHVNDPHRIVRNDVKLTLCHSSRGVNDSVIRQAIIDRFGGKDAAVGKKSKPGPLYGMKADEWQAFAVGLAWIDMQKSNPRVEIEVTNAD